MKLNFILPKQQTKAIGFTLAALLSVTTAHAACDYNSPIGTCKLTAELKSNGLQVITDAPQCASVDYQHAGATQRMLLNSGRGIDPKVTSGSSGVNVISCTTYAGTAGNSAVTSNAVTATSPIKTVERVVNTNLVATGQRAVSVQVPIYEKRVYVERQIPVEKKVFVEKPVYIEKHIPVEKKVFVEKPVYVERQVPVEKPVYIRQNVPVDRPVYVPYYIKPQVDVRYNQVVQGLPAGVQVPQFAQQGLPQQIQQQFAQQQVIRQPLVAGQQVIAQPQAAVVGQQQVIGGVNGFQPAGTIVSTTPLR